MCRQDNGINASVAALDGQIEWVRQHYPAESQVSLDGRPLLIVFDGAGEHRGLPGLNSSGFTVRWIGSQLQGSAALRAQGYWSWMVR